MYYNVGKIIIINTYITITTKLKTKASQLLIDQYKLFYLNGRFFVTHWNGVCRTFCKFHN